jgi:hypothetical protein
MMSSDVKKHDRHRAAIGFSRQGPFAAVPGHLREAQIDEYREVLMEEGGLLMGQGSTYR